MYTLKDHGRLLQQYPCSQFYVYESQRLLKSWFQFPRSTINEIQSTKRPMPCFKCGGPHFQREMHEKVKVTPMISSVITRNGQSSQSQAKLSW